MRERGLKLVEAFGRLFDTLVAPRAGAWIEIDGLQVFENTTAVAPRAGAWIEITPSLTLNPVPRSLPVRERGLKLLIQEERLSPGGRSPCGSVD